MGTGLPKLSIPTHELAYPDEHNLSDTPEDSPSNSPPTVPTAISPAQLSPFSEGPLTPNPPSSHITVLKSKTARDGRIKRPENAFILFRRHRCRQKQEEAILTKGKARPRQAELSKLISQEWKTLPTHERSYWETLAKEMKEAHAQEFPDYQYRPRRSKSSEPATLTWASDLAIPPQPEKVQDSKQAIKIMVPLRTADSPSFPSQQYAYQEIVVPKISTPSQDVTPASVWEKYESALCGSKQNSLSEFLSPSLFPPVPKTPFTPHLQPQTQSLDSDVPALSLSPISFNLDTPLLFPPPPSDHLASPFRESVKMPTYQTPIQDTWLWQSPSQTAVNAGDDIDLSFVSPTDLGIFEKIDYGFAGDYTTESGKN